MAEFSVLGLDVETTLHSRALCVIQLACEARVYLMDALRLSDLEPLGELMANPDVVKVIHNASFERSVFRKYGIEIDNVLDTLERSRMMRPRAQGGHSLKAVCQRELGLELDKAQQTSDWTRRPLTPRQEAYAALDAEVLLQLHELL